MTLIEAIIIAIVEGITEFLPVSSTGHMIIAETALGVEVTHFVKIFTVAIQLGAIFAVVVLYWKKFVDFGRWQFYLKLLIGVIPALFFGFLFSDLIDDFLESPTTVAISLVLGGIVLLFVDRIFNQPTVEREIDMSYKNAFIIGLWQVISMIPGVSRSGATIVGGLQQKLTRTLAAEFSFFLAVPTMAAATAYTLFLKKFEEAGLQQRGYEIIMSTNENLVAFITGNIVAFVVAMLAMRLFVSFLTKHGFRVFGLYRIIAGLIILAIITIKQ